MSRIVLKPDEVLATLLDGKVTVRTSDTQSHTVRCYAAGQQPEKGLGGEFIAVEWNGSAESLTEPLDLFQGNLALTVCCKLLNSTRDGQTVNTGRVDEMLSQIADAVDFATHGGYFFRLSVRPITPTTKNLTPGYSTTVLNVEWHTTDSEEAPRRPSLQSESGGRLLLEDNSQNKLTI